MQKTNIDYLTHTWNPIAMRCTRISPGCTSCWHLRMANRLAGNPKIPIAERDTLSGKGPFVLRKRELEAPLKLRKPAVIGVQFMGDLFHENMPFDFIKEIFEIINQCPQHIFLLLTKREKTMELWSQYWLTMSDDAPSLNYSLFDNIWSGLTVCTQAEADEKIPIFLQVPGKKFLSIEPMLENIDLKLREVLITRKFLGTETEFENGFYIKSKNGKEISWIIAGAETGPHARPCDPDWLRSIRDQCQAAGVPFWLKQVDKKGNRMLDGREHNERPF